MLVSQSRNKKCRSFCANSNTVRWRAMKRWGSKLSESQRNELGRVAPLSDWPRTNTFCLVALKAQLVLTVRLVEYLLHLKSFCIGGFVISPATTRSLQWYVYRFMVVVETCLLKPSDRPPRLGDDFFSSCSIGERFPVVCIIFDEEFFKISPDSTSRKGEW